MKTMTNNMVHIVQDPHAFLYSFKVKLLISFPSIFSFDSSTN